MSKPYNAAMRRVHMPTRISALPVSETGYPVPWFVDCSTGTPDFRVVGRGKVKLAFERGLCWICGQPLGRYKSFVIGPMCAINRVSSEPPSHRDCGIFAARACPFLTRPRMVRNEKGLPVDRVEPPGIALARNPGVAAVWTTRSFAPFPVDQGSLFSFDDPSELLWFAQGRSATDAEVRASIESGMLFLEAAAALEGPEAVEGLHREIDQARRFLPMLAGLVREAAA